jgi:hypothetical protein
MGRRGSGKTSYLRTVLFDKDKKNNGKLQYDYYVEMHTANAFTGISRVVQGMTEYGDTVFVEGKPVIVHGPDDAKPDNAGHSNPKTLEGSNDVNAYKGAEFQLNLLMDESSSSFG